MIRYIVILLFLSSCSAKIVQTTKTVEKDSVHVDTVKTRKIVKTKGDSTGLKFNLNGIVVADPVKLNQLGLDKKELSTGEIGFASEDPIVFTKTKKEGRLIESVSITKKGNVTVTCKEDSLQHIIDEYRIKEAHYKRITTTQTNTIVCPPKTKWQSFCELFTWIILAMLAGGIIYRFRKKIPYLNIIP